MAKIDEQMYRDGISRVAMNVSQWLKATSNYPVRPVDDEPNPKPETYILWFPSGNAAAVRREALCEAIEQVLARDADFSAIHDPQHGMLRK